MNNEEKVKRIKKVISILVTILSLVLIIYGGWNVFTILRDEKKEKDSASEKINTFRDSLGTTNYNPEEEKIEFNPEDINTIGIMTIEEINVEAPIAWMPATGRDAQEAVLSAYIGQDETSPNLGMGKGNNSIFYSHSSIYSCAHCYFNNIDELKEGDIIKVLYFDNNEYMYIVTKVLTYLDPTADNYNDFLKTEIDKEKITLVTCTDGYGEYRTLVYAERLR